MPAVFRLVFALSLAGIALACLGLGVGSTGWRSLWQVWGDAAAWQQGQATPQHNKGPQHDGAENF